MSGDFYGTALAIIEQESCVSRSWRPTQLVNHHRDEAGFFVPFKMKPQHLFQKCCGGLKTLLQRGDSFTQHVVTLCG